ncbi:Hypothetical protein A7982_02468 [Minicystis rosea]|nr:Hypothetical protein A7982_02468 [Minicystis rosea]
MAHGRAVDGAPGRYVSGGVDFSTGLLAAAGGPDALLLKIAP